VRGEEKKHLVLVLLGWLEQPRQDKNVLAWHDELKEPTKEGPLSVVLLKYSFGSVLTLNRGPPLSSLSGLYTEQRRRANTKRGTFCKSALSDRLFAAFPTIFKTFSKANMEIDFKNISNSLMLEARQISNQLERFQNEVCERDCITR
jgi:hypothetical protein